MKRLPEENFEDYQERRKSEKRKLKARLKPILIWPSSKGTYIRAIHGALK